MNWFDKKVQEINKKEIKCFRKEISKNSEMYIKEVSEEGFDNTHDYENMIIGKIVLFVSFIILLMLGGIIWWLV